MEKNKAFGERLSVLMKHYGLNKNSLTNKVGLPSNSVIGRIVNEKSRPSFDVLEKILLTFKSVNARWLVTNEGSIHGKETASEIEKGEIGYYKAGTGDTATAILSLYGFVDCRYAFDVFGDSMAPRFKSGDIIICTDDMIQKPIHTGEAYYLSLHGNGVIRVVNHINESTYKVSAENSRIGEYDVDVSDISHIYQIKGLIRREVF